MPRRDYQGECCDAVVRVLERSNRAERANIELPETTGVGPPVELRLTLGTQLYAIEHTEIEAFGKQIQTAEQFASFIDPVTEELSGSLPGPAIYELIFPIDARLQVRPKEVRQISSNFIEWIKTQAEAMNNNNPDRPTKDMSPQGISETIEDTPPGFPYSVTFRRKSHWSISSDYDGVLLVSRNAPRDVSDQRKGRIQEALRRKCPKLYECKKDGARTVLVMEDRDISLTNYAIVGEALIEVLPSTRNPPDEIFLVETSLERWTVRQLKYDDSIFEDMNFSEFQRGDLTNIMTN